MNEEKKYKTIKAVYEKKKSPISHRKHTRGKNNPLKRYWSKIGKSLAEYELDLENRLFAPVTVIFI